jgi:hypothetical protein
MTKRFKRIYEDVDVFCRDTNKRGCQLIGREDYDKIVDLLNQLHEEKEYWKEKYKQELEKNSIITVAYDKQENAHILPKRVD